VAECPTCQAFRNREYAFDTMVRPAMLDVAAPDHLPEQILVAMRRARRERQRARSLYASLAAAAALFVAVAAGWYVNRPYDLVSLYQSVGWIDQGQIVARFDPSNSSHATGLKSWLVRNGISTTIPQRLRIRHLSQAYIVDVGGRKVPVLELRDGLSVSRVFLLERRYFSDLLHRKLFDAANVISYVIADHDDSNALGWMICDQGTPNQFVDGDLPESGL
jgi:hypothetical protein